VLSVLYAIVCPSVTRVEWIIQKLLMLDKETFTIR